jgi:dTDP-glucose pyrophosphorylase
MANGKKTNLVVMAAGMGSRFGGLKQMAPFGPHGEAILDYSVTDAVAAGFDKTVIILRRSMESDFREAVGRRLERMTDVVYAFQESEHLPGGFQLDPARTRPLGTAHAVLSAAGAIDAPFAVINSDDFYGAGSYRLLHDELTADSLSAVMIGFRLGNTLTENGTVNRGICRVERGCLAGVTEREGIDRGSGIPLDTVVSMNMWGFCPDFLPMLEEALVAFLPAMRDPLKDELYLPSVVDSMIRADRLSVKVLISPEQWYGVTYREDADALREAIRNMIKEGRYRE